jgi:DNA polymerase III subunit delta'
LDLFVICILNPGHLLLMWKVIGQERAISLLGQGLAGNSLAHAYLFVGPEHIGKMTLAINLAQALNCEAVERPCQECPSCKKIAAGNHADVQIVGLGQTKEATEAKLISIEQVKDMQHSASLPPFEGKHRVFIIEEAGLLSIDAANRLLKTLEEPADRVTFILLTVNERLLLATVVSRCQRLELRPLSIDKEAAALGKNRGLETGRAKLLAGLSRGCPGWAIAAAGDSGVLEQRDEELNKMLELIGSDSGERFDWANRIAARFSQNRTTVYRVLELWLDYWHDMMLVKLGCTEMVKNIDRKEEMTVLAGGLSLARIRDFIRSVESAGEQLRQNVNTRLALEVLMLDMPAKKGGVKAV